MKKLLMIFIIAAILSPASISAADNNKAEKNITKKKTQSRSITTNRNGNWSKIKDLFM